jgi:hypothetical protein
MSNVTIKYGDDYFFVEGEKDEVDQAIIAGKELIVKRHPESANRERITFYGDVDWTAVDL